MHQSDGEHNHQANCAQHGKQSEGSDAQIARLAEVTDVVKILPLLPGSVKESAFSQCHFLAFGFVFLTHHLPLAAYGLPKQKRLPPAIPMGIRVAFDEQLPSSACDGMRDRSKTCGWKNSGWFLSP